VSPQRIQRQRTKGWRMPEGAVYVGRPTKWGNPYKIAEVSRHGISPYGWRVPGDPSVAAHGHIYMTELAAVERAVALFALEAIRPSWAERISELADTDLACWCPLDQPCDADVLLRVANGGAL
jgi:Domain of unknown function (DUF4326)